MTIDEAINELINSDPFKEAARQEGKLRMYLSRINNGKANVKVKIDLLEAFGYIIDVKSPEDPVTKKKNTGTKNK